MPFRHPAPLLFSAVAATVVMLPWAVCGLPPAGHGNQEQLATTPLIVERPLTGIGGGETIRDVHQDTPFTMVALTASDLTGTQARVRAKRPDGSWSPWYEAETLEGGAPSPTSGTDPVFVGRTTDVQLSIRRPAGAPRASASPPSRAAKPGLGYLPATVEQALGQNFNAVLISPPEGPVGDQMPPPEAVSAPGQPPAIISRAQWGAQESWKCGNPLYDNGIRAAIVHHTAGSNDYAPEDSAGIIRSIYAYHTRTLGWCDIAYNALVDKFGQVFEGRAGGITRPVEGSHTGGFNADTWGVAMIGDFETVPPSPIQLRNTGRLIGWRLGMDHIDPKGGVALTSAGSQFTFVPKGVVANLPTIFTHRDVGITECPGNAAYAAMPELRDIAAHFNDPFSPRELADSLRGGAIYLKWTSMGGKSSVLGEPTSPEGSGEGSARYVTFDKGAVYWSPKSGAAAVTGAIYEAWANLGYERGALGLPTSGEIQEPQWVVQNFQHGTLNLDREKGTVTRVIDGVPLELPASTSGPAPVQLERFTRIAQ